MTPASTALSSRELLLAARNLTVDRLTGEVAARFEAAGIPCVLFKGPVIQQAFYDDRVRIYTDCDLLVRGDDWDRAVALLKAEGFADYLGPLAHPRMESRSGTAFLRGSDNVDLHATISGLDAAPDLVWEAFSEGGATLAVGGRRVRVPPRPMVLLALALHAAHHPEEDKPTEDLRRGLAHADVDEWREAAGLARRLGGLAPFAAGLRRLEDGRELAAELGIAEVSTVETELHAVQIPLAEGVNELLAPDLSPAERLRRIRSELVPNESFMRWNHPLARRGRLGLALSYPARWWFLARRLPAAVRAVRGARARHGA
jgi:hypothetical protein